MCPVVPPTQKPVTAIKKKKKTSVVMMQPSLYSLIKMMPTPTALLSSSSSSSSSSNTMMMTTNTTALIDNNNGDCCQYAKLIPNSNKRRRIITRDALDVASAKVQKMMAMTMPPLSKPTATSSSSSSSSSSLLQPPLRKRVKKSVRFADAVEVAFRRDVTKDELGQCWYSDVEYRQFVEEIRHTIHVIRSLNLDGPNNNNNNMNNHNNLWMLLDPSLYCLRGIEQHVMQGTFQMKRFKLLSHIRMVLEQQHVQRSMGISDPNALKMICMMCSREPRLRALELAAIDATERLNYYYY